MVGLNKVFLMGNLTRDPDLRYTPSGTAVVTIGLAVNREYRDKNGEVQKEVCYIDVDAWARQAELCAEHLRKGSPVHVEGRLQYDTWESSVGEKRSKHKVRADRVQFLGRSMREERDEASGRSEKQHAAPVSATATATHSSEDDIPF